MKHNVDTFKVARQSGVKLLDAWRHSPASRRPGDCYCKPTVREIGKRHGEDHLRLVLMLLTGDKNNGRELYADVLKAVSRLLVAHPELIRRASLITDFNSTNIGLLRRQARMMKCDVPTSDVLLVLLSVQFNVAPGDMMTGEAA